MKKTKKLLSLLTALAMTASAFAAMVIPASAEPDDPAEPTWQIGSNGSGEGDFAYETYQGKDNVLHVKGINIYAETEEISEGTVNINTDVYLEAKRSFRIVLQSGTGYSYDTATAFAQIANSATGSVYVGGNIGTADTTDSTEVYAPTKWGWYNIDINIDYSKKEQDDFVTVSMKDADGTAVGTTVNVPTYEGVDKTLKAIRLVSTANEPYFANFKVKPGTILAPVATPEPKPTLDPDQAISYEQNFDSMTSTDDLKTAGWTTSGDCTATLETDSNGGKYLKIAHIQGKNSRGNDAKFCNLPGGTSYAMEFDLSLDSNTDQNSEFTVLGSDYKNMSGSTGYNDGIASGYIIDMSAGNSETWTLNKGRGGKTVTVPRGEFCHYKVLTKNATAFLTIEKSDGTKILDNEPLPIDGAGGLAGLYWRSGRSASALQIDNIKVRNVEDDELPAEDYYTATINTTRYAIVKTSDNQTYYADVNGVVNIYLLKAGTTFDYTISKSQYKDQTGTVTITDGDFVDSKPLESQATSEGEDVIYFESDFGNAAGTFGMATSDRAGSMALGTIDVPALATFSMDFTVSAEEEAHITWVLKNAGGNILVGLQGTADGLFAFTGWSGNAAFNQSDDVGKYTTGVKIADSYVGTSKISFVFDSNNKTITAKCGDVSESLALTEDASNIASMVAGKFRTKASMTIDNVMVSKPDPNYVNIVGDTSFAKIKGKTVTRQYTVSPAVIVPDEVFTWSMEPATVEGVTLNQETGELSVTDAAPANTKITLTATSTTTPEKNGSLENITIADFQEFTLKADGPKSYNNEKGSKGQYIITSAADTCGDEVKDEMPAPVWTSSNAEVATIDAATGELTVVGKGQTTVTATVTNDTKVSKVEIPVTVDNYYITKDVAADTASMDIDVSDLYKSDSITGYLVTTSKDGKLVKQEEATGKAVTTNKAAEAGTLIKATYNNAGTLSAVETSAVAVDDVIPESTQTVKYFAWDSLSGMKPLNITSTTVGQDGHITADTTGADKVEVAPIFETKMNVENLVPADRYNVTVTASNGQRTDVYVNDQMMFNNINQGSDNWTIGRIIAASTDYVAEDVVIGEGYATFKYMDDKSGGTTITNVKFVKAPSIVTRAKRIYVIGDSLVAKYYGDAPEGKESLVRTGWGDVLQNYVADGIKVTNLGNSGAWATGMIGDAFTNVVCSAQEGDIVVWESGYNDSNHGGAAPMKEAMTTAAETCKEMGVDIYFVTPNASSHDYGSSVHLASDVCSLAEELEVNLIDLSALSYKFLSEKYGEVISGDSLTDEQKAANAALHAKLQEIYNNTGDTLHSSYNAANCWAAIVAQGLPADVTNTTYKYTFNDGEGDLATGDITVGVGLMPTLE